LKLHVQDRVEELFHRAVRNTATAQGGTAEITYKRSYPPTINTAQEADIAATAAALVVGQDQVMREGEPLLAGEDFAFMLQRAPGAYLFFGQRGADRGGTPVHNPNYDFNDDLLPIGASYLATIVEHELR
jgi:hippurate hydrolase